MRKLFLLASAVVSMTATEPAKAAYLIEYQEVGPRVISTGSGSLNLSDLTSTSNNVLALGLIYPSFANATVGAGTNASVYAGFSGPSNFGGGPQALADVVTGNPVGIINSATNPFLFVPNGYVSNTQIGVSTAAYLNESFASLGATPGTYVWNWGSGANADTFTVQIGPRIASGIPEPSTWALLLVGFFGIGGMMRLHKHETKVAVSYA